MIYWKVESLPVIVFIAEAFGIEVDVFFATGDVGHGFDLYADTFPLPRKVERLRPKHQRRMLFYPCSQISLYGSYYLAVLIAYQPTAKS